MTTSLQIQLIPNTDNAVLLIDDKRYHIDTAKIGSLEEFRTVINDQPDHIFEAVVDLLHSIVNENPRRRNRPTQ